MHTPQRAFAKSEGFYHSVQEKLDKKIKEFQVPYSKHAPLWELGEKGYYETKNNYKGQHRLNELWRRHIQTILSSDKYSNQAKQNAIQAWDNYLVANWMFDQLDKDIDMGVFESGEMEARIKDNEEAYNDLIAVMEAYGYDLEEEVKKMKTNVERELPIKLKKVTKKV